MPVSIWLSDTTSVLDGNGWLSVILETQRAFEDVFGFSHEHIELWDGSYFEESEGTLVQRKAFKDFSEGAPLLDFIKLALKEKLILKINGTISAPILTKAFIVYFLRSEDRWEMPHVFCDTTIENEPLTDLLWSQSRDEREKIVTNLVDNLHYLKAEIYERERRILDRLVIAKDFPDEETLRDGGILLYHLGGPEVRLLRNLFRSYSKHRTDSRKRISMLNLKNLTGRLYSDPFFNKVWELHSEGLHVIPGGSLTLISKEKNAIPKLLRGIEEEVVGPFLEGVPKDLYDVIMDSVKKGSRIE